MTAFRSEPCFVYRWRLVPAAGLVVEVSVEARSVASARRKLDVFLERHLASAWEISGVARRRVGRRMVRVRAIPASLRPGSRLH